MQADSISELLLVNSNRSESKLTTLCFLKTTSFVALYTLFADPKTAIATVRTKCTCFIFTVTVFTSIYGAELLETTSLIRLSRGDINVPRKVVDGKGNGLRTSGTKKTGLSVS